MKKRMAMMAGVAIVFAMAARADEFVGPFPSWFDVKRDFGAVGDGVADDTAAIQRGLDALLKQETATSVVLYFPAGTYRITDTVSQVRASHHEPLGRSLIGEDPETTRIVWDGEEGASMLHYDSWFTKVSRLTFDGAGKAKKAIDFGNSFSTANEISDMVFKDVGIGIAAGIRNGIAETAVLRCRFYRCADIGISIQGFNSLDWYIWECWFEECGIGASNELNAGNFHLYYCTFLRSKEADVTLRHTSYFSALGNVSLGSRLFLHAKRAHNWLDMETWAAQITIQDNTILDPREPTPILFENNGPNLILDNVIRAKGTGPAVRAFPPSGVSDLIVIGNRWTSPEGIANKDGGRLTAFDNTVVSGQWPVVSDIAPVPFLAKVARPVIEVAAGADAATIQAAIDAAAALNGQRPVVHLPKGKYALAQTLVIPAGCDVQLIGDGGENGTELSSAANHPAILVKSPSKATFRTLSVNGGNGAGILVENADCGGRIYGEQVNAGGKRRGIDIEGLKRTPVEMRCFGHDALRVAGGGDGTQSWVTFFAGATSRHSHQEPGIALHTVTDGGRLLARDFWYEGESWMMAELTGGGDFACHSAYMCPVDPNHFDDTKEWERDVRATRAAFHFDGFKGKAALTLVSTSDGKVRIVPPSPDFKLCLLGFFMHHVSEVNFGGDAFTGSAFATHRRAMRSDGAHPYYPGQNTGTEALPDMGETPSPDFLREMLVPLRTLKPQPPAPTKDGEQDLRFFRVFLGGNTGLAIQP